MELTASVDAGWIEIEIVDDGPGFAADILPRLGEPYVTSRPQGKARRALAAQIAAAAMPKAARRTGRSKEAAPPETVSPSQGGMGLGFFIARTLLERTGGKVSIGNGPANRSRARGARVSVRWPREVLEPGPSVAGAAGNLDRKRPHNDVIATGDRQ